MHPSYEFRLDRARGERIHGDAVHCKLNRQYASQHDDAALRGTVGSASRAAHNTGGRGEVDDATIAAFGHDLARCTVAVERSREVSVKEARPLIIRRFDEGL